MQGSIAANELLVKVIQLQANEFNFSILADDASEAYFEHRIKHNTGRGSFSPTVGNTISDDGDISFLDMVFISYKQYIAFILCTCVSYICAGFLWNFASRRNRRN